jgi:hypothetical protein
MEIASPEVLVALRNAVAPPAKTRRASRNPETSARPKGGRRRRCQCGVCRTCQENARWERIFVEKFADPDYYRGISLRTASPLTSL